MILTIRLGFGWAPGLGLGVGGGGGRVVRFGVGRCSFRSPVVSFSGHGWRRLGALGESARYIQHYP